MMPQQKPGKSKQDYGTPRDFLSAVEERFGKLDVDLACTRANAKAPFGYFYPECNSLDEPWAAAFCDRNLWLNPPFLDIEPWAAKCKVEGPMMGRGRIIMLTPASIGSNWYADHVHGNAHVIGLSPRMTFDGTPVNPRTGKVDPYPKDLMLTIFGPATSGFSVWRWKPSRAEVAASPAVEDDRQLTIADLRILRG